RAGTMVSILLMEQAKVEELIVQASAKGLVRIANYLCPGNLVCSGEVAACEELANLTEAAGARTVRLAVAGAFHTPLRQPAVETLSKALEGVNLSEPSVAVWANVTARPHTDAASIRALLARQVVEPVRWEETVRGLLAEGVERFYEIGP